MTENFSIISRTNIFRLYILQSDGIHVYHQLCTIILTDIFLLYFG